MLVVDVVKKQVACPHCGAHKVRLSLRHGFLEHLMSVFLLSLYRCRGCRRRFYRFSVGIWKNPIAGEPQEKDSDSAQFRDSNREQFWGY